LRDAALLGDGARDLFVEGDDIRDGERGIDIVDGLANGGDHGDRIAGIANFEIVEIADILGVRKIVAGLGRLVEAIVFDVFRDTDDFNVARIMRIAAVMLANG
jgi:hypothetical protein